MLPYYIDFFSNKNYSLLPLDRSQDLMWFADAVWGREDYSNLNKLYKTYIKEMPYPFPFNNEEHDCSLFRFIFLFLSIAWKSKKEHLK